MLRFNDEEYVALLQDAVQRIQNEENLIEITRLKRIFKKTVPLSRRSYVGCYLAKVMLEQGARRGFSRGGDDRFNHHPKRPQKADEGFRPKGPPKYTVIDESRAATIFISVGKNKRVFPRDLVTLIIQGAGIPQDRIGEIHVFDNYSFIQLFSEDAENAITSLNGREYRGRPLSVSYSRKKDEAPPAEAAAPPAPESPGEAEAE
ncbi:MAG: DbpA RNA binding domain-containing protein [Spirochaetaceae bacterium]|jgi:RNA recognition motif-containing protein|nr:DbpA RNA binding domain-containing protein [Spirochaetaceae bacterium]